LSNRISEPDGWDVFPSVSLPVQQNFEEPTNLLTLSMLFLSTTSTNMAKMILPPRHFLIATAGSSSMRKMRMIFAYATF
jgi:hypothetical protein